MQEQPDLRHADLFTRLMARCSMTEVALALGALVFALAMGLAAPI